MRVKWDLKQPALIRALSSADTFVEVGASFIDRHYNFRTGVELRSGVNDHARVREWIFVLEFSPDALSHPHPEQSIRDGQTP
jgi:hypothetical protein